MIACPCAVCASTDPRDNRLRTSVLIESPSTTLVIDTTPDFRYQMLRAGVKKLDAVLFTHPHKDHTAGLDDVRAFNFFQQRTIPIYANSLTMEALKREFAYAFSDRKYPGLPDLDLHTIDLEPFTVGDIPVTPIMVWHLKMPVWGFRFGDFTYITDANRIEDGEKEKIRGSQTLVINALRKEKHISHYSLSEAIETVQSLRIPQAYLIHLSHQMGLHASIEKELPSGMKIAYDGLEIGTEGKREKEEG